MQSLCRDCHSLHPGLHRTCPNCGLPRMVHNTALSRLSIAHIDCDAFYASVEQRDNPSLKDKPLIVGGGRRGVVTTCCYKARIFGVRSAMPMFKARKLCPDATILRPDMAKYRAVSRDVRRYLDALTPVVEPLSLDEAFLDLGGTEALFGAPPAVTLSKAMAEIEADIGITASVGLAANKFLAKLASDQNKPRGYTVINAEEAADLLAPLPASRIHGIGKQSMKALSKAGYLTIGDLQGASEATLLREFGQTGQRLFRLCRGIDRRSVTPSRQAKSVSAETTLARDVWARGDVERVLWRQCERVSADLKRRGVAGVTVTLKLKTQMHKIITRSHTLDNPTQLAEILFEATSLMLQPLLDGTPYRLIGVGCSHFRPLEQADPADLVDPARDKKAALERSMDQLRGRFGAAIVGKGRGL